MKRLPIIVCLALCIFCLNFQNVFAEPDIKIKSLPMLISIASEQITEIRVKENKTYYYEKDKTIEFFEKYYEFQVKDKDYKNVIFRSPSIIGTGLNASLMNYVERIRKSIKQKVCVEFDVSLIFTETYPNGSTKVIFIIKEPIAVPDTLLRPNVK